VRILLILLLLSGCASIEERPVKTGSDVRVVTLYRTYQATEECNRRGTAAAPGWKVAACASFNNQICTIVAQPTASDEILGHEVRHCFDGAWHKQNVETR
jgi:uncharacterized protein YceK